MMLSARFIVILLLITPVSNGIFARDSLNIRMLGEVHDFVEEAYDVAVSGNYAYLSSGLNSGLRVLDLSDPAAPVEVGYAVNTDPCPGSLNWMTFRIHVSGNYVYLFYFDGTWSFTNFRLYIYNVSDPRAPTQMGCLSLPDNCTDLFVKDGYVYITSFEDMGVSQVSIIDVSEPMYPYLAGSFGTPGMAHEVYVAGNKAYVADNGWLVIYDVTNPAAPVFLGSYTPKSWTGLIHHVAVIGDYVILTDSGFGIRILDASNPSRILEAGSVRHHQTDVLYSSMKVSGDLIYYTQDGDVNGKQLVLLDVADPETPAEAGVYDMQDFGWIYGFDYENETACIAGGKDGLKVVKIYSPEAMVDYGLYQRYDLTTGLAVSGDYAYVGTYMNDLIVYDVSDPSSPVEVNSLQFPDSPIKQISVWENHLYVPGSMVNFSAGISVLDISDPANPEEIAYWAQPPGFSGLPLNLQRYGNYAFVACAIGGVEVYDVSEVTQPAALSSWTLWDAVTNQGFSVTNVIVSWPYLYAVERALGLYVLDISDPSNIVEAAGIETPGEAMWAAISPDHRYLYIADAHEGLRVIDVSNPPAPVETGYYKENIELANHVTVSGDYVYVSDCGKTGLHMLDVSDPEMPVEVGYHKTPGVTAHKVVVNDGLIYFLDHTHFEIFEVMLEPNRGGNTRPEQIVSDYKIHSVYPNPFNASANIVFDLAGAGNVKLSIYNSIGELVQTLPDDYYQKGRHTYKYWPGNLTSGIYILHLQTNGMTDSFKLVLMK